ncbi:MAG: hypothetical protein ACRDSP_25980 [Pseudonocardiaceae bacterium]
MTQSHDNIPAHPDETGPATTDVARILETVAQARFRADDLDIENSRVAVLRLDLDIALRDAQALTDDLGIDGALALTRDLGRVLDLDLDLECEQLRELVRDVRSAHTVCERLASTLNTVTQVTVSPPEAVHPRPGRLPLGIVRVAVRVLPDPHRARYDQEFRAELTELAEQSRRAQLGYALRQLTRCGQLRRALADALAAPKR